MHAPSLSPTLTPTHSSLTSTPTHTLYNTQTNMSMCKQSYTLIYIRRERQRERENTLEVHSN